MNSAVGKIIFSSLLCGSIATQGMAAGAPAIGNEVISARSMGMGGVALAGQMNDPAVAYYNPAALPKLPGAQVTTGLAGVNPNGEYIDDTGAVTKAESFWAGVPNFSATYQVTERLGIGLAIQSPYGLESHWADNSPMRYVDTDSVLHLIDVGPAIGYKVTDFLSLGAGADYYNIFDISLERKFPQTTIPNTPDAHNKLSGTAANWGYRLSFLVEPNSQHAFGFTYRGPVKMTIKGTSSFTEMSDPALLFVFGGSSYETAAYTDLFLPQNVQMGYSFRPNDRWLLEADAGWYDWGSGKDLNIRYAETDPVKLSVLNLGNPQAVNRRSSWSISSGANYKHNDRLQIRGGFFYLPWATPESAFTPSVLDLSRYGLCTGVGYELMPKTLTLDFNYSAIFSHTRHIHNDLPGVDGTYKNFTNLIMTNLTYRFLQK